MSIKLRYEQKTMYKITPSLKLITWFLKLLTCIDEHLINKINLMYTEKKLTKC